jgi:hypothetical protein
MHETAQLTPVADTRAVEILADSDVTGLPTDQLRAELACAINATAAGPAGSSAATKTVTVGSCICTGHALRPEWRKARFRRSIGSTKNPQRDRMEC